MPTIAMPRRMSAKVEESGGVNGSTFSAQVPLTQRQLSVLLKLITTGLEGFVPHCEDAGLGVSYASVSLCAPPKTKIMAEVPVTDNPSSQDSFGNGLRVNVLVQIAASVQC